MAKKVKATKQLWKNILDTIRVTWQADKKLFILFVIITTIGALIPLGFSYSFKLLLDEIIKIQGTGGIVTVALLSFFTFRYILEVVDDFQNIYLYQYVERVLRYKLQNLLTYSLAEKISNLDMAHFEDSETQSLLQKTQDNYTWRIPNFINNIFYAQWSLIAIIGSFLALIPFGFWIPIAMLAANIPKFLLGKRYSKVEWSVFDATIPESKDLRYLSRLLENPDSVKELRIFQSTQELLKRFKKLQNYVFEKLLTVLTKFVKAYYWPMLLELAVLALLAYLKLDQTAAGIISIGSFTFFIQTLSRLGNSAQGLARQWVNMYDNNLYIGYYFETMELEKIIKEKDPGHVFDEIKSPKIEFQNVTFNYPDGPPVLKNISFTIEPGQHLAIVGPNGAGKTTLIKLLLRFYDPNHGQIMIGDYDLRDIKLSNWYSFLGTLFQNFVKFDLTVRDNIILGNPREINETKLIEAAKKSGADEFIRDLPKKYDQRLGKRFQGGVELSQGQWQKLALARAFYEEAPVLVLDEPTSAIDAEAESAIFENLYKVYEGKTLVLISHRFSTVRNADKIIVLKNGKMIEEGNHQSLMKADGVYARMFQKQAKGYVE